ncbi:hypothetical protein BKA70DRAFT_1442275 [Coprinopsis sp. MPI-PUGE-AT-0042]|nr:hypothetical protein BKA70DRAFT_1442275 [Coprinopsis sp. MPI-PUGE-AT-0042]
MPYIPDNTQTGRGNAGSRLDAEKIVVAVVVPVVIITLFSLFALFMDSNRGARTTSTEVSTPVPLEPIVRYLPDPRVPARVHRTRRSRQSRTQQEILDRMQPSAAGPPDLPPPAYTPR